VPEVAQVGAGLFFGRVGPEEEGELLARDWAIAMQDKIRQQLLQARLIEALDGLIAVKQAERSEQVCPYK